MWEHVVECAPWIDLLSTKHARKGSKLLGSLITPPPIILVHDVLCHPILICLRIINNYNYRHIARKHMTHIFYFCLVYTQWYLWTMVTLPLRKEKERKHWGGGGGGKGMIKRFFVAFLVFGAGPTMWSRTLPRVNLLCRTPLPAPASSCTCTRLIVSNYS